MEETESVSGYITWFRRNRECIRIYNVVYYQLDVLFDKYLDLISCFVRTWNTADSWILWTSFFNMDWSFGCICLNCIYLIKAKICLLNIFISSIIYTSFGFFLFVCNRSDQTICGTSHDPRKVYGCSEFQKFVFMKNLFS